MMIGFSCHFPRFLTKTYVWLLLLSWEKPTLPWLWLWLLLLLLLLLLFFLWLLLALLVFLWLCIIVVDLLYYLFIFVVINFIAIITVAVVVAIVIVVEWGPEGQGRRCLTMLTQLHTSWQRRTFTTPLRRPTRSSPSLVSCTVWCQGRYNSPAMSRARSLSVQ